MPELPCQRTCRGRAASWQVCFGDSDPDEPAAGRPSGGFAARRCPAGHRGDIYLYLHGQRKRPDSIYARSRFRCPWSDGSSKHTFALPTNGCRPTATRTSGRARHASAREVGPTGNGDPVLHVQRRRDRAGLGPQAEGQAELACAIERK